jgi:hypothetical protein
MVGSGSADGSRLSSASMILSSSASSPSSTKSLAMLQPVSSKKFYCGLPMGKRLGLDDAGLFFKKKTRQD